MSERLQPDRRLFHRIWAAHACASTVGALAYASLHGNAWILVLVTAIPLMGVPLGLGLALGWRFLRRRRPRLAGAFPGLVGIAALAAMAAAMIDAAQPWEGIGLVGLTVTAPAVLAGLIASRADPQTGSET